MTGNSVPHVRCEINLLSRPTHVRCEIYLLSRPTHVRYEWCWLHNTSIKDQVKYKICFDYTCICIKALTEESTVSYEKVPMS